MRKIAVIVYIILCNTGLWAQTSAPAAPQTGRQALIEMFSSREPGTFLKHLPAVTRAALDKSGSITTVQQYSALAGSFHAQDDNFKIFETGPILFAMNDPKKSQRVEAVVESDSLHGDRDDIELSFRTYKDGQLQRTGFMPHVTLSMKMESGAWTLNDIGFSVHLPIGDPDFLKAMTDGIKSQAKAAATQISMQPQIQAQPQGYARTFAPDAMSLSNVRTILTAEKTYASTYPLVGYTCTLSDLDGFGAAETNEHQAMLINSGLASGHQHGYTFSLSGCSSSPVSSFGLTATPIGEANGRRVFCADQTGAIRAAANGDSAACFSSGTPVQ
jgi:hypothetical protein